MHEFEIMKSSKSKNLQHKKEMVPTLEACAIGNQTLSPPSSCPCKSLQFKEANVLKSQNLLEYFATIWQAVVDPWWFLVNSW